MRNRTPKTEEKPQELNAAALLELIKEDDRLKVQRCLNMECDLDGDEAKEALSKLLESGRSFHVFVNIDGAFSVQFSELLFFLVRKSSKKRFEGGLKC